jgi:hypothetical protein
MISKRHSAQVLKAHMVFLQYDDRRRVPIGYHRTGRVGRAAVQEFHVGVSPNERRTKF